MNASDDMIGQLAVSQTPVGLQSATTNAPIVLSAEALTSLLTSHMSSGARSSSAVGAATAVGSAGSSSSDLIQYLVDQSVNTSNTITISLDSLNLPADSNVIFMPGTAMTAQVQSVDQVANDLEVGAQEMVLDIDSNSLAVKHHPLHL